MVLNRWVYVGALTENNFDDAWCRCEDVVVTNYEQQVGLSWELYFFFYIEEQGALTQS